MMHDDAQTLVGLGLTYRQAKTYLTILNIGDSSARNIARASNVSRPNLYTTISSLEKLGLVEKIIMTPTIFRAVPLKIAIKVLIKNKTAEYISLKKKSRELLEITKAQSKSNHPILPEENQSFVLLPSNEDLKRRIYQAYNRAQTSLKAVGPLKMFQGWDKIDIQVFDRGCKRGVKFQLLIHEQSYDDKLLLPFMTRKSALFDIRLAPTLLPLMFCLFDKTELFFGTTSEQNFTMNPQLWTTNQSMILIVDEYFERIWQEAKQINVKELMPKKLA
jgi:sugar-specific transcriptional regulator TrmB